MNKLCYRKIFSKRLGMLVAVAECTRSQGKHAGEGGDSSSPHPPTSSFPRAFGGNPAAFGVVSYLRGIALAVGTLFAASAFAQLPAGGAVTRGAANINYPDANTLNVDQTSQRAVINWSTFSIGKDNTVQFFQPNSSAAALNIVTGGQMSNIQGALLANGQVLIQNANGVLFGNGAIVNVGSLLATTKNVDQNAFMAGGPFTLSGTGTSGSITNDGAITATGYVTLMADQVRNSGSINAGSVTLAAGDSATVALNNGQGISVTLTDATAKALIENKGTITADGAVLLTAKGSDTLLNTVINLSGVVKAGTAIVADAGNTGDVVVTGTLDATNVTGGTVVLSGNRIGLFGDASIDASGDAKGGTVIIGGDLLNKLPTSSAAGLINSVTFADYVQVDSGATIKADSAHGDGGFIETSGKQLSVKGQVSAAAPKGKAGLWLIDPTDVYISNYDEGYEGGFGNGTFNTGSNTSAYVDSTTISNALNGSMDVTLTTANCTAGTAEAGNIVQEADADIITNGTATLTLLANSSISLNGNITAVDDGVLNLTLTADIGGTGSGMVYQQASSAIDLGGGALEISGNGTDSSPSVVLEGTLNNIGSGSITGGLNDNGGVLLTGSLTKTTDGTLNIIGSGSCGSKGVGLSGPVTVSGGTLNITGDSTGGNGVYVANLGNIAVTGGNLSINGHSACGTGLVFGAQPESYTVSADNVTFNGSSDSGQGMGDITANLAVNGTGHLTLIGESGSTYDGLTLTQNATVTENGSLSIIGTATDTGMGVCLSSATVGDNGTLSITGRADTNVGLNLSNVHVTGNGTLEAIGVSNGSFGITGVDEFLSLSSGNVTLNGTSHNANTGVNVSGPVTVNGTGNLTLIGTSDDGDGLNLTQAVSVDETGRLSIIGTAKGDGMGVCLSSATVGDNGTLSITGRADTNVGLNLSGVSVSGNGTLEAIGVSNGSFGITGVDEFLSLSSGNVTLNGTSSSGSGIDLPGDDITVDGTGLLVLIGKSGSGDGFSLAQNISVSDNGSLRIIGTASGANAGVALSGNVSATGDGIVYIVGDVPSSNGIGVKQAAGSSFTTDDAAEMYVFGSSLIGTGVSIAGVTHATGNSTLGIEGTSAYTTSGVNVDGSASIISSGNGRTLIIDDSTDAHPATIVSESTIVTSDKGMVTVCNATDCINYPRGGSSSDDDNGGTGYAGAMLAGLGIAGGGWALVGASGSEYALLSLATADALIVAGGDSDFWADATLDYIAVDANTGNAEVHLLTKTGTLKRELKHKDKADGVDHYTWQSAGGSQASLSVNPRTREYFYTETGVQGGQPYTVKAHGWLMPAKAA